MHSFTSFIAFSSQKRINWPFCQNFAFIQNMRTTWFFNDFSQGRKKAISRWKDPREIKILSNVGFSSAWICIANFAIARSYITEIFSFWPSDAIRNDLLIVSATTHVDVGDWLICGRYHIFWVLLFCGLYLAFHPTHIGVV